MVFKFKKDSDGVRFIYSHLIQFHHSQICFYNIKSYLCKLKYNYYLFINCVFIFVLFFNFQLRSNISS